MTRAVLAQLRAAQNGDPWYGSPRTRFLEGLSAAQAAARPIAGGPSIWALVLHMTSWTREATRRLEGGEPAEPAEGDWPPVGEESEAEWDAARAGLAAAHARLLAVAAALSPEALAASVGQSRDPALGTGVTRGEMLVGLAQHDAYHTGQIALLRRLVVTARAT